jgi:hypothetical protein
LTLSADQITDEPFRLQETQELTVKILDEETLLLVALSDRSTNGRLIGQWPKPYLEDVPVGTTRFERIRLGPLKKKVPEVPSLYPKLARRGLFLKLMGLERRELHGSNVLPPGGFSRRTVSGLVQAFTPLSQAHKTRRISNTGNVYNGVFCEDLDNRLVSMQ